MLAEKIVFPHFDCPVSVVHWRQAVDPRYAPAYHRAFEAHLIRQGHGVYMISGEHFTFQSNSLIVIQPYQTHRLIPARGETNERVSLFLLVDWLSLEAGAKQKLLEAPHRMPLSIAEAATFDILFKRIDSELSAKEPDWITMMRLLLQEFLVLLNRVGNNPPPLTATAEDALHREVVRFVDTHYAEGIRIADLARHTGFSASHLAHCFKASTGMGIKQYILHRRVLEAQRLLKTEPGLTISAVSEQVGFSHHALFHRVFKSQTRTTPGEYRTLAT